MHKAQVLGYAEVAKRLEISKPYLAVLAKNPRARFPKPLAVLECGSIWQASTIDKWRERNNYYLPQEKRNRFEPLEDGVEPK